MSMYRAGEGLKYGLGSFSQDMNAVKHFWIGWVEETYLAEAETPKGPLDKLNRVRVRIFGYNDINDGLEDLPVAQVLMPNTVGNVYDIGSIFGLEVGSQVLGMWLDRNNQTPVVLGAMNGYTMPPLGYEQVSEQNSGIVDVPDNTTSVNSADFDKRVFDLAVGGDSGSGPQA